jgi:hypothetical protein
MGSHLTLNIVSESCLYDTNVHILMLGIMWFQEANYFLIWPCFYYKIFYNARSQKNTLQQNWLYLKLVCLNMNIRKFLSEIMTSVVLSVFSIYIIQKKWHFSGIPSATEDWLHDYKCHNLWKEPHWVSQAPCHNVADRQRPRIQAR